MKCANCGGKIKFNEHCQDCGIDYWEMINNIKHPEMRRLFKKIENMEENHQNIDIEASMMACELLNSSLIMPVEISGKYFSHISLPGDKKNNFLVLCTDMDEFKPFEKMGLTPLTNSWGAVLKLLRENEGVVINIYDEACFLTKNFMKQFFSDKLNTS